MKWEEVRRLYPDQYVKLNILNFHMKNNKKIVTDVALIDIIKDSKTATKELLRTRDDVIVYHTGTEEIVIEMRNPIGLRGIRL
ncbi:hypothetical protein [Amphibacillus indicireducens]|uniref:Uncharacterized protein n=1 Tax=Amphibacillus indicireducens TaxID=1076330 RepID=A0ABP7VDW0_9BACI